MKRVLFTFLFFSLFSPVFFVYAAPPIKILIVPGHDNKVWGSQYRQIKEADMTLALGTQLFNLLKKDKRFEVHIARDSRGFTPEFASYLSSQKDLILAFEQTAKKIFQGKVSDGSFVQKINAPHNNVTEDIALRLYGFNKWANENKMDAVIHIHFNDYPRPTKWTSGQYKGFAIYMPDSQFVNSKISSELATNIFTQLHKSYITSNYKPEAGGLVHDQKLIAIGANNTLDASVRSVLIEYGYIYRFGNSTMRHNAYITMANLTATGIKNSFFKK